MAFGDFASKDVNIGMPTGFLPVFFPRTRPCQGIVVRPGRVLLIKKRFVCLVRGPEWDHILHICE